MAKLRDKLFRQLIECRVTEIMSDHHNDLWGSFRGVQKTCDEVCGYKKNRKCDVTTWWWNSGAKNEIQKKNDAYKELAKIPQDKHKLNTGDCINVVGKQLLEL